MKKYIKPEMTVAELDTKQTLLTVSGVNNSYSGEAQLSREFNGSWDDNENMDY